MADTRITQITFDEFVALAGSPAAIEDLAGSCEGGALVVRGYVPGAGPDVPRSGALTALPLMIIGVVENARSNPEPDGGDALDVVVLRDSVDPVVTAVIANPVAATALVLLLRVTQQLSVHQALVAESMTYSTLQAGPEHGAWLEVSRLPVREGEVESPVLVRRQGDRLGICLNRPLVRNAYNAAMRDALLGALQVAASDPALTVEIHGAGPAFSSGGDLTEFGTRRDPASAHLLRVGRSPAGLLASMRDRVTCFVHGPCIGAGVELPAFAGRVVAGDDATFHLPEVSMGLVPGAGGTVSVTRRIGRQRTALMALADEPLDVATARDFGLVDEVVPRSTIEARRADLFGVS